MNKESSAQKEKTDKQNVWRRRNRVMFYVTFPVLAIGVLVSTLLMRTGYLDKPVLLTQKSVILEREGKETSYFQAWIGFLDNRSQNNEQTLPYHSVHFPEIGVYGEVTFSHSVEIGSYVCWWMDIEGRLQNFQIPEEGQTITKVMLGDEIYDLGSITVLKDDGRSVLDWKSGSSSSEGWSEEVCRVGKDCIIKDAVLCGDNTSFDGEALSVTIDGKPYAEAKGKKLLAGDSLEIRVELEDSDPFTIQENVLALTLEDSQGKELRQLVSVGDSDFFNGFQASAKEVKAFLKGKGALP